MEVGLREANQRFARIVRAVKGGEDVVLTERGHAVAVIAPLPRGESRAAAVQRLEAAGVLRAAAHRGPMPRWRARPLRGAPVSETIREERERS